MSKSKKSKKTATSTVLPADTGKFWARPPSKNISKDNHDDIYLAVGKAVSAWELIEFAWVNLFCYFIEAKHDIVAKRTLGVIMASNGRMSVLAEAAELYFEIKNVSQNLRDDFNHLRKHMDLARTRRNEIAHAVAMGVNTDTDKTVGGVFLIPAMYNSHKNEAFYKSSTDPLTFLKATYRLTAADINHITERFWSLNSAILKYMQEIHEINRTKSTK
jgi:hypothetical protein